MSHIVQEPDTTLLQHNPAEKDGKTYINNIIKGKKHEKQII